LIFNREAKIRKEFIGHEANPKDTLYIKKNFGLRDYLNLRIDAAVKKYAGIWGLRIRESFSVYA
jgi:hypothetical protein